MQWMATAGQMCPFSPPKTKDSHCYPQIIACHYPGQPERLINSWILPWASRCSWSPSAQNLVGAVPAPSAPRGHVKCWERTVGETRAPGPSHPLRSRGAALWPEQGISFQTASHFGQSLENRPRRMKALPSGGGRVLPTLGGRGDRPGYLRESRVLPETTS